MPLIFGNSYMIGYSGLRARQMELDIASDNLANINTPGFKERRAAFQAALRGEGAEAVRAGVQLASSVPIFTQGSVQPTGQLWDVAINGPGFFRLRMPDGSIAYSRVGVFHPDAEGTLVNSHGYVLDPPIVVPENAEFITIDGWGQVSCTVDGLPHDMGRIHLAHFANPEGLMSAGDGLYLPTPASGEAIDGFPAENGFGILFAGALEMSNVDTSRQLISIMQTQRAYSLTLQALKFTDQMAAITNQLEV